MEWRLNHVGQMAQSVQDYSIYGTVIIWICLNYVISKNILLICQKTSLQLPVDIFPYLNGGYATDNIAKITP